jgi:hypothetical protein
VTQRSFPRRTLIRGAGVAALGAAGLAAGLGATPALASGRKSGPLTTCYVEVNNHSIANVGKYVLESNGATVFDIGLIFAANINYDGKKAYLHLNEQVQATLDNVDTLVRPLQQKGIKVVLSVLGNHEGAGFANFPSYGAASEFAAELAKTVYQYGLDGIDFDDEWVEYGKNGTAQPNAWSFPYLTQALRRMMPDKLISLYYIGPSSETVEYNGIRVGDQIDFACHPYYGGYAPPGYINVPGLTRAKKGAAAVWIEQTDPVRTATLAAQTVADGCGYFNTYDLQGGDHSAYISSFTNGLYGSRAVYTG